MANEFVARKGLIVSGSTTMSGSLEVETYVSASSFTGSLDYDNLVNVPEGLVSSSDQINTGSFSGSFFGDGSGLTGIDGFPFTGSAEISGSLIVDGTVTASFFSGDGSGLTNVTAELTTATTFGEEFVSQSSITVTHDLDTNSPLVQVYDENDEQIIPDKIKILNNNEVLIEFPVEVSGRIVVGKGGDLIQSPTPQFAESFISESSITINHLLDTDTPIVQVYDANDEQITPQKIKVLSSSSVLIEFSSQTTGKAVVAKGGHIIDAVGLSYVAQDFTNAALVSVTHSFGTDAPIVQVYSDTGLQIIPQQIRIIDQDKLEVEFSTNRSGKVAVSKGGHILTTENGISGSFTGSFSGSYTGDGSGLTGIDGFPYTGSAGISGSLTVDGPVTASAFFGDGSGLTGIDGFPYTGSAEISGSLVVDGPVTASAFFGDGSGLTGIDITGTTSYAEAFASETSVTIFHNLDTPAPIIQVYDENDEQLIPAKIKIIDSSSVLLEFAVETSGNVVVAKAGHIIESSGLTYKVQDFISTSSIIVSHGFDTLAPIVQVYDDSGSQILPDDIVVVDANSVQITFTENYSGKIAVSKGGHVIDTDGATFSGDFSGSFTGSFTPTEDILPSVPDQIDIGSPTNRFRDIYLSGSTIFLGNVKLSESEEGTLKVVDSTEREMVISEVDTGSIDLRLDSLEAESGSVKTAISSSNSRIGALENFSSSLDDTFATDGELSSVQSLLQNDIDTRLPTSSFDNYTSSAEQRFESLEVESGSIRTAFNNFTGSSGVVSASSQFDNLGDPFTGSFTGSFTGDGAGLTGIAASLAISGSTGNDTVDLKTDALTFSGENGVTTVVTDNTLTIGIPQGTVSSSGQINHNSTTNYISNEHIDHSAVNITAGDGISGGGDITVSRTLTLDTGSGHFVAGIKDKLNSDLVVSGSDTQVKTFLSLQNVDNTADIDKPLSTAQKTYVDEVAQGLKTRSSARVLVDSNLSATYDNGVEGSGSFLESNSNGAFPTTDGINSTELNIADVRILVIGQTNKAHNGLYVVQTPGDSETPWKLRRCRECDSNQEIPGSYIFVKSGTVYGNTGWVMLVDNPAAFTVGTDNINPTQFSGAGSFLAGNGLDLDGNVFGLDTGSVHFTSGIKTKLNTDTIVSSSAQVVSLLPTGTVSGSSQIAINSTTGTLGVDKGGTGATTAANARTNLGAAATNQTMHIGTTAVTINRTSASQTLTGVSIDGNAATATTATSATTAGNVTGTVAIANGGTGATTAANARTNLDVPTRTGGNASGTWGISITGNAATATLVTGTSGQLQGHDIRTIAPASITAGRLQFGFTSWNNNNTSPWADFLHLRSYSDGSGGSDNLVTFRKDAIGMRIWQQSFGSATSYATFKDVAFTDSNITGTAANVTGTVAIANGGTGATTAANARTNLDVPTRTGGNASGTWGISITGNAATATSATSATSATTAGNVTGTVAIANGGTGATTAANARTNLDVPTRTGGNASGTWGINITGNAATVTNGVYTTGNQTIGGTKTFSDSIAYDNSFDYAATGVTGLTSAPVRNSIDHNIGTTPRFLPVFHQTALYSSGYRTHLNVGLYKNASGWGVNQNGMYVALGGNDNYPTMHWNLTYGTELYNSEGYVSNSGSFRSPIFYDSNNTGYYVDPASTSNLYNLQLTGPKHTYLHINPGSNYEAMVRYTGGSGSDWYVGKRITSQLVGTESFHFYSAASGRTVSGVDTAGNLFSDGSMRSPIFYDSNNTGYYVDPASTSVLNVLRFGTSTNNGRFDGSGSWGVHFRTDAGYINFGPANTGHAHIYTDRPNFYFNATLTVNDGSYINQNDIRSAIFYDRNNTAFYIDPNAGLSIRTAGSWWHDSVAWQGNPGSGVGKIEYHADRWYIVAGSNSAEVLRFRRSGTDVGNISNVGVLSMSNNIIAYSSDGRLKKNLVKIESPVEKIKQLTGVHFEWDLEECRKWDFEPSINDTGLIAQEVQAVFPDAVKPAPFDRDSNNQSKSGKEYLTVQYEKLVPLLVEAIKEQQHQLDIYKNELEKIKTLLPE